MNFDDAMRAVAVLTTIGAFSTLGYVGFRYAMMWLKRFEREGEDNHLAASAEVTGRFERLEQDVAELQERVDFAERLLARGTEAERLDAGKGFN